MSDNKEKERVVPKKNYAKLSTIFIVTILLVVAVFLWYRSRMEYNKNIPIIRGTISELETNDFDDYAMEHDDFLVYVGVANDDNCRDLESDLKDFLTDNNLLDTIYLNITSISDKAKFYDEFNKKYSNNMKLNSYPAFIIFMDGKVLDLVQGKDKKLNVGDISILLDEYEITGGER